MSIAYIYHSGVKGMRWGHQKDRLNRDQQQYVALREKGVDKKKARKIVTRNARIRESEPYINQASKAVSSAKNVRSTYNSSMESKMKKTAKSNAKREASEMSDAELRSIVKRMELESKYQNLSTKDVEIGEDRVMKNLETVGTVLAVAGSAVALYNGIKMIKGD